MIFLKRAVNYSLLLMVLNFIIMFNSKVLPLPAAICAVIFLTVFFFAFNIIPYRDKLAPARLTVLRGGYELALAAIICFMLEIPLYIIVLAKRFSLPVLIINAVICLILLAILLINGVVRIFAVSTQLGFARRAALLLLWWVPVINIILLNQFLQISSSEYEFTFKKYRINKNRRRDALCKTRYPLLMVHGIFFRDWEHFNYWGRIAGELTDNGATIFYGDQQSSASVEKSADELKNRILEIIKETGCEKVNIIAHSKGGLDSRYAVSCLGMGEYVASLTTINTPHYGCNYIGALMEKISGKTLSSINKSYKALFTILGDANPDFLTGLKELTDANCAALNEKMPDVPGVLYQSVASKMRFSSSAIFPLNLGHSIIKRFGGGDNDGLVCVQSMVWGDFLGVCKPKGLKGISHGDMIDLTRKDILGFDVCEFYVDLVNRLKIKGL